MSHAPFVHLHVHSAYSLLVSTARVEALIKRAVQWGMPALALTDQGNLFAAIQFYTKCLKAGIKPLLGAQIYLVPDHKDKSARADKEPRDQLILLCRNLTGWRNLLKILSLGHIEGSHGKPRVSLPVLEQHAAGLIALSGGGKGEVGRLLREGKTDEATHAARRLRTLFADASGVPNFYLEVQRHGEPDDEALVRHTVALAVAEELPLVASSDVHFLDPAEQPAQDALLCVGLGHTIFEENRPRYPRRAAFHSPEEMARLFADLPEALENTLLIARRCTVKLELGRPILPDFQVPEGYDLESWLRKEAGDGLEQRLVTHVLPRFPAEEQGRVAAEYRARLEYELDVIIQMGFPGYFLIVSDFIRWAKANSIPVGPGRGSGAGSLAAWALQITDLDPIRYQLLFERFLNPERVSMPDFDVDFCMDLRDRVIGYVQGRYGVDRVAQIITFGTLQARAVIRDVGRVLEFPYGRVDRIAKLVPNILGITLQEAIQQEERLRAMMRDEPEVGQLIELALALEGLPRSAGTHAAGVVMSNGPLTDTVPLYLDPRSSMPVTQFYMGDAEKAGLVKFDFLGLKTLTVIDNALKIVNAARARDGLEPLDITRIDMEDAPTYTLLKEGRTRGVFQLESSGMREILKKLAPDTFEDIIALVALYRPGPLESGMVDDFIDCKHGRKEVAYLLPQLEPILAETYGVILYQEQVMKIAQVLASYSLGGADLLRRAMGKKKPEEMAAQRKIFLDGAEGNALDPEKSAIIFDLMEKFAGYGFNKSHSAAYALIAYQTAWLKAHHPVAFLAATLTCDILITDKVMHFIRECRAMGIPVLPPDVNRSEVVFSVEGQGIRYGLAAIKNVGEMAMESLVKARRSGGPFTSLFDLCRRVDPGSLNRRMLENLIKAGACDALGSHRAALLQALPQAMGQGSREQEEKSLGFLNLFSAMEEEEKTNTPHADLPDVPPLAGAQQLAFEKEALGFYLTSHPLQLYETELLDYGVETTLGLRERFGPEGEERLAPPPPRGEEGAWRGKRNNGPKVTLAGMVADRKLHRTKKGDRMAFLTLEDMFGQLEATVFPDAFAACREHLESDRPLVVEGYVEGGEEEPKLTVERIWDLDGYRATVCRELRLRLNSLVLTEGVLEELEKALQPHLGGRTRIVATVQLPMARAVLAFGEGFRVQPVERLLEALRTLLGRDAAHFTRKTTQPPAPPGAPLRSRLATVLSSNDRNGISYTSQPS